MVKQFKTKYNRTINNKKV